MQKSYIDKLAFIDVKESRVLSMLSKGKETWYIPGGKREEGETDEQALTREVKEELKVDIIPESIVLYGIFEAQAHGKPERTIVRMTCYTALFIGKLQASAEIEEYRYVPYAWKENSSLVDKLIFDDLKGKELIE